MMRKVVTKAAMNHQKTVQRLSKRVLLKVLRSMAGLFTFLFGGFFGFFGLLG